MSLQPCQDILLNSSLEYHHIVWLSESVELKFYCRTGQSLPETLFGIQPFQNQGQTPPLLQINFRELMSSVTYEDSWLALTIIFFRRLYARL